MERFIRDKIPLGYDFTNITLYDDYDKFVGGDSFVIELGDNLINYLNSFIHMGNYYYIKTFHIIKILLSPQYFVGDIVPKYDCLYLIHYKLIGNKIHIIFNGKIY